VRLLSCREASHKVWLGLNFYGRDFVLSGGKADDMLSHDYNRIVESYRPQIEWLEELKEHVLAYEKDGQQRNAYYPSRASMQVLALSIPT
jgi:hypothetical protein